jgi:hypothetical protein
MGSTPVSGRTEEQLEPTVEVGVEYGRRSVERLRREQSMTFDADLADLT